MSTIDPIEKTKPIRNADIIQNLLETPSRINGLHNRISSIVGKILLNISNVFYDFRSSERLTTGRDCPIHTNPKHTHRFNESTQDSINSLPIYQEPSKTAPTLEGRVHPLNSNALT
jgi:hypothetical protein